MSFTDFERAVATPALKAVVRHWNDVRGARRMPAWADIKPSAIGPQLAIIWSYKYDPVTDTFTSRLAGEKITAIFGKSLRGVPMTDIYPKDQYPALFARTKRVVLEPVLMRGHGLVFRHLGRYGTGERVMLPLGGDGKHGDGMLGATEYSITAEPTREQLATGEIEEWFAFD
ncbi:MAG: PAS domain-containing protein [Rhizomicrobium sp.]|jgi:hypothetical protein